MFAMNVCMCNTTTTTTTIYALVKILCPLTVIILERKATATQHKSSHARTRTSCHPFGLIHTGDTTDTSTVASHRIAIHNPVDAGVWIIRRKTSEDFGPHRANYVSMHIGRKSNRVCGIFACFSNGRVQLMLPLIGINSINRMQWGTSFRIAKVRMCVQHRHSTGHAPDAMVETVLHKHQPTSDIDGGNHLPTNLARSMCTVDFRSNTSFGARLGE